MSPNTNRYLVELELEWPTHYEQRSLELAAKTMQSALRQASLKLETRYGEPLSVRMTARRVKRLDY